MPQPKSSSSRKRTASGGAKRTAAKPKAAKRTQAKRAPAKRTAAKSGSTAPRRKAPAKKTASRSAKAPAGATNVEALRELITRQVVRPLEMVMITRERIQDAFDDAVGRGRLTRSDAEDLV